MHPYALKREETSDGLHPTIGRNASYWPHAFLDQIVAMRDFWAIPSNGQFHVKVVNGDVALRGVVVLQDTANGIYVGFIVPNEEAGGNTVKKIGYRIKKRWLRDKILQN